MGTMTDKDALIVILKEALRDIAAVTSYATSQKPDGTATDKAARAARRIAVNTLNQYR